MISDQSLLIYCMNGKFYLCLQCSNVVFSLRFVCYEFTVRCNFLGCVTLRDGGKPALEPVWSRQGAIQIHLTCWW